MYYLAFIFTKTNPKLLLLLSGMVLCTDLMKNKFTIIVNRRSWISISLAPPAVGWAGEVVLLVTRRILILA
jgi:hypothetical protein